MLFAPPRRFLLLLGLLERGLTSLHRRVVGLGACLQLAAEGLVLCQLLQALGLSAFEHLEAACLELDHGGPGGAGLGVGGGCVAGGGHERAALVGEVAQELHALALAQFILFLGRGGVGVLRVVYKGPVHQCLGVDPETHESLHGMRGARDIAGCIGFCCFVDHQPMVTINR